MNEAEHVTTAFLDALTHGDPAAAQALSTPAYVADLLAVPLVVFDYKVKELLGV